MMMVLSRPNECVKDAVLYSRVSHKNKNEKRLLAVRIGTSLVRFVFFFENYAGSRFGQIWPAPKSFRLNARR